MFGPFHLEARVAKPPHNSTWHVSACVSRIQISNRWYAIMSGPRSTRTSSGSSLNSVGAAQDSRGELQALIYCVAGFWRTPWLDFVMVIPETPASRWTKFELQPLRSTSMSEGSFSAPLTLLAQRWPSS